MTFCANKRDDGEIVGGAMPEPIDVTIDAIRTEQRRDILYMKLWAVWFLKWEVAHSITHIVPKRYLPKNTIENERYLASMRANSIGYCGNVNGLGGDTDVP